MFGNFSRTLDDKNRVMIPSKLRENLGNVCYISLGSDRNLEIRDTESFNVYKNKLLNVNMLNSNVRKFARIILGNTFEVELDNQGRISIPNNFLLSSGITKDVTFVGVGNKIEIWDTTTFETFQKTFENQGSLDELASLLLKDGVEL